MRRYVLTICALAPALAPAAASEAQRVPGGPAAQGGVAGRMVAVLALDAAGHRYARGSGVVFARARVVTACHIVELARAIAVQRPARGAAVAPAMKARLLAHDYDRDLCVLSVPELRPPGPKEWEPLAFAPPPVAGQRVRVVGAPMARPIVKRGVVTDPNARVRGFPRSSPGDGPAIESDAAVPIGFSGGGVFDLDGRLVGIVFATRVPTEVVVRRDEATGKIVLSYTPHDPATFAVPGGAVKELLARIAPGNDAARKRGLCFGSPTAACVLAAMHEIAGAIVSAEPAAGSSRALAIFRIHADAAVGVDVRGSLAPIDSKARSGRIDAAIASAGLLDSGLERSLAWALIALVMAENGDALRARATMGKANRAFGDHVERATTGIASRDREVDVDVDVDAMLAAWRWKLVAGNAVTLAELGRFSEALESTRDILDDTVAVAALGGIAAVLARRDGGVGNSPPRARRGAD